MTPDEAVVLVNGSVFKPGWKFYALADGPDAILLGLVIETVDTSYPGHDGICRRPARLAPDKKIEGVGGMDEAGLLYAMLKFAAGLDSHENREFLKVQRPDGSWVAPLHPHTMDGELAFLGAGFADAGEDEIAAIARSLR
jgi:hypothetical protein